MTKKTKTVPNFVKQLRSIRDKMTAELEKMTADQRKAYFAELREKGFSKKRSA